MLYHASVSDYPKILLSSPGTGAFDKGECGVKDKSILPMFSAPFFARRVKPGTAVPSFLSPVLRDQNPFTPCSQECDCRAHRCRQ